MPSVEIVLAVAGFVIAFILGIVVERTYTQARLARIRTSITELANGNFAHRVIFAGQGEAVRMAEDLNRLADEVQAQREATAASDEARRQLVANISHDLRTPITSVAGFVDALQRGLGDDPERYLAIIGTKTDELVQLTDDLFYSSRLDAGDLELECAPLNLAEAVRRSILGFEPELQARNVRVVVDIPEQPCTVLADHSAVSRILSNLMSNGVRHGEEMKTLEVAMRAQDGAYIVDISNDGARLPEDAERLFGRGVAGERGGTGLGLSIARELAERMDASITVESRAATGVTFTLRFPVARVCNDA